MYVFIKKYNACLLKTFIKLFQCEPVLKNLLKLGYLWRFLVKELRFQKYIKVFIHTTITVSISAVSL